MADLRFPTKKQVGQGICLFVVLCGLYGISPSLKKMPASNWIHLITGLSSSAVTLLVAVVGYKNYQELQRKNARDAETAEQNYQALIDKNTADRFSKAVEMLGNENIHVRLGGIFALEQIATEDKYYWQIMEILTAYVRERSPWPLKNVDDTAIMIPVTTDIQVVMTVISRRRKSYQCGEPSRLDLTKTNLQELIVKPEANFRGVDFSKANLKSSTLDLSDLSYALFKGADLLEVSFRGADLLEVSFRDADITESVFSSKPRNVPLQKWEALKAMAIGFDGDAGKHFEIIDAKNLKLEQLGEVRDESWRHATLPSYIDLADPTVEQKLKDAYTWKTIPFKEN